ncbi:DUF3685 domain-containing protein [filamentous cyanobacterium CCP5]|nr:DUF3685 domain-containing protein [filamentous cyanobacterium CCP5]
MTAPLRLLLVDEDPVFRLGLRIWLEQTGEFAIAAEASTSTETLDQLAALRGNSTGETAVADGPPVPPETEAAPLTNPTVDLVVLDLGLGQGNPEQIPGLRLCEAIKFTYPSLPVLVLSASDEPVLRAAAEQMGADDFGIRGLPVQDLARLLKRAVNGSEPVEITPPSPSPPPPNPLVRLRRGLRQDALRQIEAAIAETLAERQRGRTTLWNDAVLAGRYRELRAARWLVNRLLATPNLEQAATASASPPPPAIPPDSSQPSLPSRPEAAITTTDRVSLQRGDVQSLVFEAVFRRLQGSLANNSEIPLEIDILRDDRRRELFYLILRQLEDALGELRQAQVLPGQLGDRTPEVLRDVWEAVTTDFFGRYYTVTTVPDMPGPELPVVKVLLQEEAVVRTQLLEPIPLIPQLIGHLLYRDPLPVDGSLYIATTPEALSRSRELLEHLLIQLANGVMLPVLNRFGDVEQIKKNLYSRRLMSTRDIERFRNDLSWRYRWDRLVNNPKAVFESQYRLFGFTERGIQPYFIYAPRREELDQLSGIQLSVTLAIEARDAIAPRLRSAIAFVGSGVVYVLTELVGRGIGLVGRGILKGIGSAWNDAGFKQDRK